MKLATLILAAGVLYVAPVGIQVSAEILSGIWPTCRDPGEVEPADVAAEREAWDEFKRMNCALLGARGMRARVIRCAADVTNERMKRFSHPVPRDDSLPSRVCELEIIRDDGSEVIGYTFYLNIEISP